MSMTHRVALALLMLATVGAIYAANRYDNYTSCVLWSSAHPQYSGKCSL
jgi:hypothetical protein